MEDKRILQLVAPLVPFFVLSKQRALDEWKTQHPDAVRITLSEVCRARFMHDRCIAYAETELSALARVLPVVNMRCIVILDGSDALAISPKLIDGRTLRSSNYVTKTRRKMRQSGGFLFDKVQYQHLIWGHAIAEDMTGVNERIDQIWLTREREERALKIAQLFTYQGGAVPFDPNRQPDLFEPVTVKPKIKMPVLGPIGIPKVGTDVKPTNPSTAEKSKRAGKGA